MNYSVFIKSLKYILLFFSISILILVFYNNNPIEKEKVFDPQEIYGNAPNPTKL